MKRLKAVAALVVCAAIAYGVYRIFLHENHLQPAVITPQMDAQEEVSPSLPGWFKRFFREHIRYSDRSGRPKLIALSFDDGPYPVSTPLLLDELNALKIHATFFLIGHDAQLWPELTQRIERSGDEIANHTLTHPDLDALSDAQVGQEITGGRQVLQSIVHDPAIARFFRPPHGRYTVSTIQVAQRLGYTTVLWNDDPGDWRSSTVTPSGLAQHLRRYATAPDIVLLHNGKLATIEMLPQVVASFRAAGYRFVTVGQLLAAVRLNDVNHPAKRSVS